MPTTPTDDPIANSDRTVGIRGSLYPDDLKALKREALLFDQIDIPALDSLSFEFRGHRVSRKEVAWLRDRGIVRAVKITQSVIDQSLAGLTEFGLVDPRKLCVALRLDGINAFPILETRREIGNLFPSGTCP